MWFVIVLQASMREGVRYSSLAADFARVIGELFQRQVLCLDEGNVIRTLLASFT